MAWDGGTPGLYQLRARAAAIGASQADSPVHRPKTAASFARQARSGSTHWPPGPTMGRMNRPITMQCALGAETSSQPALQQPLRLLETSPRPPSHADVVII